MSIFRRRELLQSTFAGLVLGTPFASAMAQNYPNKPIRLIVPYPVGGAIDLTGRMIGDSFARNLGQAVVVDNRAGANGMIGLEQVYRAEGDGYTLALTGASNISAGPHLQPMRFNPLDMPHISRLVKAPLTLAVRNDFPAKNVAEFIAYAKTNEVSFGSAGVGSSHHLTGEMFRLRTGTKLSHVPYKGSGPMLNDLMGGVIDASFGDPTLVRYAKSGKLRVLGASSDGPWKVFPEIPVIKDTVPGFVAENWYGLAASPKTPKEILAILHEQVVIALNDPTTKKKFEEQGLEPAPMSMDAFKQYVEKDSKMWAEVIKAANVQL